MPSPHSQQQRTNLAPWSFDAIPACDQATTLTSIRKLSKREVAILCECARFDTAVEIAEEHHVAVSTINSHMNSIFRKLGVKSRTRALVVALQVGCIKIEDLQNQ